MTCRNNIRITYLSFFWFVITCPRSWETHAKQFPIGTVFDVANSEFHSAFAYALSELPQTVNETEFQLYPSAEFISESGEWCMTSHVVEHQICKHGSVALIAATINERHLEEFFTLTHKFHVPIISPWIPASVKRERYFDYEIRPTSLPDAVLTMISHYGYKKFIYLYSGQEGLLRLQTYYDSTTLETESIEIAFAKRFSSTEHALQILHDIENSSRWAFKLVVLDCPIQQAKELLTGHARDQSLGRRTFHYLVGGFAFDHHWDPRILSEVSVLNITGFRIMDKGRTYVREFRKKWSAFNLPSSFQSEFPLTVNVGFIYDSILVLKEAMARFAIEHAKIKKDFIYPNIACNLTASTKNITTDEAMDVFKKVLRHIKVEGLTGNVQFTKKGRRTNFTLNVMEVKVNGTLVKVGDWSSENGLKTLEIQEEVKKNFICTSVLEAPYLMLKEIDPTEPEPVGNDRFEGFFKDFADYLASELNVTFTIQVTNDYGSRNTSIPGGWSGMIGELVRNEADIGIGAMTSNAAREKAVILSKSILFIGISIMLFKPEKTWQEDIFAFMRPLSRETWICVGLAYLGVSVVLYLIAKYNEKELHSTQKQGVVKLKPQFSMSNSLWFTFASLVGQGTDLCPRSISARLVGSVWWFLILIVTSSYTANFAAIQTVNRMEVPINSASDLANQQQVKYAYLAGGATAEFFRKTKVPDYKKMAEYVDLHKEVHVATVDEGIERVRKERGNFAFLLESTKNKYTNSMPPCNTIRVGENLDTKGYVLGLSESSGLSIHKINTIILEMREEGLVTEYEQKWLKGTNLCGAMRDAKNAGRLSLETLIGVFYILIIGLLLALLIQLFEFWVNARKCKNTSNELVDN